MKHQNFFRAYSQKQFHESGFDASNYCLNDIEGTFVATLDCKCWGKSKNLLAYFTLQDGRKIVASSWFEKRYLGLAEIPFGSNVILTFSRASTGIIYLKGVALFPENNEF